MSAGALSHQVQCLHSHVSLQGEYVGAEPVVRNLCYGSVVLHLHEGIVNGLRKLVLALLEADAVLVLDDGRYALVEVKLGSKPIDTAAANLKKLASKIDATHQGEASFLLVLTGTATAYRREDGVVVAPLASLAP